MEAGLQAHGPDLELCMNLKDATLGGLLYQGLSWLLLLPAGYEGNHAELATSSIIVLLWQVAPLGFSVTCNTKA